MIIFVQKLQLPAQINFLTDDAAGYASSHFCCRKFRSKKLSNFLLQ